MRSRSKPHPKYRDIHGILLLDKPLGVSSNQALQAARRLVGAAKGGHTGSLDPLATGLLPLCFGEATKIAGILLGSRKAYEAECLLGVTTTTADAEGEALLTRPVPDFDEATLEAALAPLRGAITQVPPVYSAIKREGVPLYVLARQGVEVEVPPRQVQVDRLEVLARHGHRLRLLVECGSGTYVRSLVADLGESLGCGAHVTALRRLWIEPFEQPTMITMAELETAAQAGPDQLEACVLPMSAALAQLPVVALDVEQGKVFGFGQPVPVDTGPVGRCSVLAASGRLMALGEVGEDGILRSVRGFNLPEPDFAG
jgi:tRNA pseudouridine55 synthase